MNFDAVYIITIDLRPEYLQELIERANKIPLPEGSQIILMEGFLGKNLLENPQDYPEYRLYPDWNLNDGRWWWWQRPALAGEAGGMISHTKCWEHAYENGFERILILEDDFLPTNELDWNIFEETEGYDWDLCLLSHNSLHEYFGDITPPSEIRMEYFIKPTFFYNTHSYILTQEGIRRLVEDHLDMLKQNIIVSDEFLSAVIASHPRPDVRQMFISNIRAIATRHSYITQTGYESAGNSLTEPLEGELSEPQRP